ncbi:MAG: hypothetical protein JWN73_179 [Betaproteobacteria bacterium]|nr:hypothetical protein [Betaproteobacteria bacterium]
MFPVLLLVLLITLSLALPLCIRSCRALAVYAGLVAAFLLWAGVSAAVAVRRPDAFMPMGDMAGALAVIVATLGLAVRAYQLRFDRLYAYLCGGA